MSITLYTVPQAAEILGLHPETVREIIRAGELQAARLGSRTYRIREEDLNKYIESKVS